MKLICLIIMLEILLSCSNDNNIHPSNIQNDPGNSNEALLNEKFNIIPDSILKDFTTWYNYTYYNVQLSQDFIGLDTDSTKIDKTAFLNKLMTGKVVAFKIRLLQGEPVYKLYKLNSNNENIKSVIEQLASIEMKNYKMEGQQIPAFNFTDLNGNEYNTTSTKGKILLLKCWFIHCAACVQEFPECNKLVDEYKGRNDVLFISLASDTKNDLTKFLNTKVLKYAVIPQMDNYMINKLNINMYPTDLLIDRTGKIIKVVNSIIELEPFLKKEIEKPHD
jgi:thiol-disulfide isomerase/thioredoxin